MSWYRTAAVVGGASPNSAGSGALTVAAIRAYIWACVAILVFSAILKLLSLAHYTRLIYAEDPVFGVRNLYLYAWAGVFELSVAALLALLKSAEIRLVLLAFVSGSFGVYRCLLAAVGFHGFCPCLGSPLQSWPLLARHQDALGDLFFWFLLLSWLAPVMLGFLPGRHRARAAAA